MHEEFGKQQEDKKKEFEAKYYDIAAEHESLKRESESEIQ